MEFQPHYFSEDELESIYHSNIERIKKFDFPKIGITNFITTNKGNILTTNDIDFNSLLNNFRKFKIIGFNFGKFGDFEGWQKNYAPPGAVNWRDSACNYYSFFIYAIYVDIVGNCYGQIQVERINQMNQAAFFRGEYQKEINWFSELFAKPFTNEWKLLCTTTDFSLIQKCINDNNLLEYSFPEYKKIYKEFIGPCDRKPHGYFTDNKGFSDLIGKINFKNIGEKCNEEERIRKEKIEEEERIRKQKIEEATRIALEKKRQEDEKIAMENKKKNDEINFCQQKIEYLKPKYGINISYKFDEKNKKMIYIESALAETLDLSDFIQYTIKKRITNGKIIPYKIGNIKIINIDNCPNLVKIIDFVEGLEIISLDNCPLLSRIECYDKVQIVIDRVLIEKSEEKDVAMKELFFDLRNELQELRKFREGVETHYPAMIELLRQRIEKLEK